MVPTTPITTPIRTPIAAPLAFGGAPAAGPSTRQDAAGVRARSNPEGRPGCDQAAGGRHHLTRYHLR
jgi:hypothetical protein